MTDLTTAVTAYLTARADADSAPPWARIMREDVAGSRMRELLAACFAADVSLDGALVSHAPDYVRGEAERWGAMVARIVPPAPVVLGPWQTSLTSKGGRMVRYPAVYPTWPNAYTEVGETKTLVWSQTDKIVFRSEKTGQEGQGAADEWMRAQGWVLLDAEPLPEPVALGAWYEMGGTRYRDAGDPRHPYATVEVDSLGWSVKRRAGHGEYLHIAHGPQTGPEGERLAMVAALALGFGQGVTGHSTTNNRGE